MQALHVRFFPETQNFDVVAHLKVELIEISGENSTFQSSKCTYTPPESLFGKFLACNACI